MFDAQATPSKRIEAVAQLAVIGTEAALKALLQLAQDESADEAVARAGGEGVARVLIRQGRIDEAPLADLSGAAYLGFDEAVALHLEAMRSRASGP